MSLCDNCNGACCRSVTIKVQAMTDDQVRWADMRGKVTGGCWRIKSPCENLGPRGACTIYYDRPEVCRQFAEGGAECLAAREVYNQGG